MSPQEGASVLPAPSGFRFSSGRLCLDLAATLTDRGDQAVELLVRPSDLGAWLHPGRPSRSSLLRSHRPAPRGSKAPGGRRPLRPGHREGGAASPRRCGPDQPGGPLPGGALLDPDTGTVLFEAPRKVEGAFGRIALDAVDFLGGEDRSSVKACARPGCGALFVDRTRTGSRRWCSIGVLRSYPPGRPSEPVQACRSIRSAEWRVPTDWRATPCREGGAYAVTGSGGILICGDSGGPGSAARRVTSHPSSRRCSAIERAVSLLRRKTCEREPLVALSSTSPNSAPGSGTDQE
jgi:hypothetical protein